MNSVNFTGLIIRQSRQLVNHVYTSKWTLSHSQRPVIGNHRVIAVPKKDHLYSNRLV